MTLKAIMDDVTFKSKETLKTVARNIYIYILKNTKLKNGCKLFLL